ncbi:MAG: hypothetical protein LUI08_03575 [Prevotella sp.]|nr:hypothetical protein [Prevotella sp.]
MVTIPTNIYEHKLSKWINEQLAKSKDTADERLFRFLKRLSKFQIINRQDGEMSPFDISEDEIFIIQEHSLDKSENLEIRAYCLDLKQRRAKDKRQPQIDASSAYLELYEETNSPWFLMRAVTVRTIKVIRDLNFVERVARCMLRISGIWLVQLCTALRKSYDKEELVKVKETVEDALKKSLNPQDLGDRRDERYCLMALEVLGAINRDELHWKQALSFEKEIDYLNSMQDSRTINMGKEQIAQNAYNEIEKVKNIYPDDYTRIRNKLLNEQIIMKDNISKCGVKISYSISERHQTELKEYLEKTPIDTPEKLISYMKSLSFIDANSFNRVVEKLKRGSSIWEFFDSSVIGNRGQTIGEANPEEAIYIHAHRCIRFSRRYTVMEGIINFLEHVKSFDDNLIIQAIVESCKSLYIPESRRILWAQGIVEMMKDNCIASVHILMPQVEYALLKKAEYYHGIQTKLEQENHQDEPSLEVVLRNLQPHFKDCLYDEFRFFFNSGADSNVRNKLAHGLCEIEEIIGFAPYLWWLAIKMFWCDDEIFL